MIKLGNDQAEGIQIEVSDNRVFITGTWKGRTSKSKKGHWNMSWHSKELFDEAIKKYKEGNQKEEESW